MPGPSVGAIVSTAAQIAASIGSQLATGASARQQMKFQERMRATQYQTAVEDMRKAGLNPMLAYMQGGAGTPSGASAEFDFDSGVSTAIDAVRSAREGRRLAVELETMKTQQDVLKSQAGLNRSAALRNIKETEIAGLGLPGKWLGALPGRWFQSMTGSTASSAMELLRKFEESEARQDARTRQAIKATGGFFKRVGRWMAAPFSRTARERRRGSGGF